MPLCPNDCQSGRAQPVFTQVSPQEFAELQEEKLAGRKGVKELDYDVMEDSVGFEVVVIPQAYKKENFFKHRRKFERDPLFEVRDREDSVEVLVQGPFAVKATQCSNCNAVYDSIEDRVFDNATVFGLTDQFATAQ